jgi:hypothetical protein
VSRVFLGKHSDRKVSRLTLLSKGWASRASQPVHVEVVVLPMLLSVVDGTGFGSLES